MGTFNNGVRERLPDLCFYLVDVGEIHMRNNMTERLRHQCHRNGCDSQSTHQACLAFWCVGPAQVEGKPATRIQMKCTTTIKVCERHQSAVEGYVLSDRNKSAIAASIAHENLPPPDFSSAEIIFIPIVNGMPVADVAA